MIVIPLTRGLFAWIDDEDAHLAAWKWYARITHGLCYAARMPAPPDASRTPILLHREVMRAPIGIDVDHVDGNKLDCRRHNLRLATKTGNRQNVPKTVRNTSGFKGVAFHRRGRKWQAGIGIAGRRHHLGLFATPEAAARAYDAAARVHFGAFGRYNFPREGERAA